jgi:hypothetical protein
MKTTSTYRRRRDAFTITFAVWCATTAIFGTLACQIVGSL